MTGLVSAERIEAVRGANSLAATARRLGVALKKAGREFIGLCPFHNEKTASFTVNEDKGFYHCFGCGAHGDVIDLVRRLSGVSFRQALADIAGGGLDTVVPAADLEKLRAARLAKTRAGHETMRKAARRIWLRGQPIAGTAAGAYLLARGVEAPRRAPLRFVARLKAPDGSFHPAMVAAVQWPDGRFAGVHRTWLKADGSGKADLPKAKMTLGPISGGAIRLMSATERLVIAEGIETALSLVPALHREGDYETAVWCGISTEFLKKLVLPRIVRDVVIAADGDSAGEAAAHEAASRFAAEGRAVRIARAPSGLDFNDVLLGAT